MTRHPYHYDRPYHMKFTSGHVIGSKNREVVVMMKMAQYGNLPGGKLDVAGAEHKFHVLLAGSGGGGSKLPA